jgi:hypothetical protein
LEDKAFRAEVLKWHDAFSETKPREADNRVSVLARVMSWAKKRRPLAVSAIAKFENVLETDVAKRAAKQA